MVINGKALREAAPILDMLPGKVRALGVSHGLAEVGYDIRIQQSVRFTKDIFGRRRIQRWEPGWDDEVECKGRFILASAMEAFNMPENLVGVVHDKSTWARRGLSVFNTVIEPGWRGFLTLELVYHGDDTLWIPAGAGIAQVLFHESAMPAVYHGKYQGQVSRPVEAIAS